MRSNSLQAVLTSLSLAFTHQVVEAIQTVAVKDFFDKSPLPKPPASGPKLRASKANARLKRRSQTEIQEIEQRILAVLRSSTDGFSSGELQDALELSKKELTGPLQQALLDGKIRKEGERRGTKYFKLKVRPNVKKAEEGGEARTAA